MKAGDAQVRKTVAMEEGEKGAHGEGRGTLGTVEMVVSVSDRESV